MKQRVYYLDFLKIVAMLMVVLSHCLMEYKPNDFYSSVGFNAIWLLQMPLFMFISGYLQNNKSKDGSFKDLLKYIGKKFLVYIIPFITFTFLSVWQLSNNPTFVSYFKILWNHTKDMVFNIDKSLWFCFVIFIFTLQFAIAKFISIKLQNKINKKHVDTISFAIQYILFILIVAVIGYKVGFNFLGAKYIVYYSVFYYFGYIYKELFENKILKNLSAKKQFVIEWTIFGVSTVIFLIIICVFKNIYTFDDFNIKEASIRLIGSFAGMLLSYLFAKLIVSKVKMKFTLGKLSLEFYFIHILLIRMIKIPITSSVELTIFLSFLIITLLTLVISLLVNIIPYVHYIIFGSKSNIVLFKNKKQN